MSEDGLGRALLDAPLPDEGAARERARRTVLAAHAATARRRRPRAAALVTAAALATLGIGAVSRPGQAVGEWLGTAGQRIVNDVVHRPAAPRPLPRRQNGLTLPAAGRLLVTSAGGLWIVDRDGARHRLGAWTAGAWSPYGIHVVVTSGRRLAAVRPDGALRWSHTLPAPPRDASWAPDGLHIAYRSGGALHVIWGNGLSDTRFRGAAAAVAPAWRPGDEPTLAWARPDGTVIVKDAGTGLELWRHRAGPVRRLAWSADGRRLLIAGRRHGAVHDIAAGRTRALRLAPGEELTGAAFSPTGSRLALAVRGGGHTEIRLLGRRAVLVDAPLRLRGLAWSPDGRWLIAGWPSKDQWLVIETGGGKVVKAITGVQRRFGAGAQPLGWCCPNRPEGDSPASSVGVTSARGASRTR